MWSVERSLSLELELEFGMRNSLGIGVFGSLLIVRLDLDRK